MKKKITAWVSVKDKLPSERDECIPCYSKQVLCRLNGGLLTICQYDFANKRWLNSYDHLITHWMSIPELEEEQSIEEKITAWIARDCCGDLYLHKALPHKSLCEWRSCQNWEHELIKLDRNLYPQVKWEDEEPTKVELTIKIKE